MSTGNMANKMVGRQAEILFDGFEPGTELDRDVFQIDGVPQKDIVEMQRRLDELNVLAALAENPMDFTDESYRIKLFTQLSRGLRLAGEGYAVATVKYKMAVQNRKEAEAIASLDEFGDFMRSRAGDEHIKATEMIRKNFVCISPSVKVAYRQEAFYEGILEQFSILKTGFNQSISTLRSMAYGYKDSANLSWGADAPRREKD